MVCMQSSAISHDIARLDDARAHDTCTRVCHHLTPSIQPTATIMTLALQVLNVFQEQRDECYLYSQAYIR